MDVPGRCLIMVCYLPLIILYVLYHRRTPPPLFLKIQTSQCREYQRNPGKKNQNAYYTTLTTNHSNLILLESQSTPPPPNQIYQYATAYQPSPFSRTNFGTPLTTRFHEILDSVGCCPKIIPNWQRLPHVLRRSGFLLCGVCSFLWLFLS